MLRRYEIRIVGVLDARTAAEFAGLDLTSEGSLRRSTRSSTRPDCTDSSNGSGVSTSNFARSARFVSERWAPNTRQWRRPLADVRGRQAGGRIRLPAIASGPADSDGLADARCSGVAFVLGGRILAQPLRVGTGFIRPRFDAAG